MNIRNFEFKAKVNDLTKYENKLLELKPEYRGTDHQTDTYFNVKSGRLKLREGNIENSLISYDREDTSAPKLSEVILYRFEPDAALKNILVRQLGIRKVVKKDRKIYFIGNVKFHFDVVEGLGTFLEVEAIDSKGELSVEELKKQCYRYFEYFELNSRDLVDRSYSDML